MKANPDTTANTEVGVVDHPLGYTIQYLADHGPVSRSQIYAALKVGQLKAKKAGRRTIVPPAAWSDFLDRLPDYPVAA